MQWMMPSNVLPADIGASPRSAGNGNEILQARLADLLAEARQDAGAPSMSAAVTRDDELIWAGSNGYVDIKAGIRATPEHLYRLGSTSKALTGILLGRMIDSGTISLSATIGELAPELPAHLHEITLRQLASHTSGVRHYSRMPTWIPASNESITSEHFPGVRAGLELFVDDDLQFEPGSGFNYSTFGYSLLSYGMELAGRADFGALLNRQVNEPLEVDLRLDDLTVEMRDRAATYTTGKGRWGAAYPSDPSYKWAGGGIIARPRDLASIGQALLSDGFLQEETRDALWSPVAVPGSDRNPQNYGLGWRVDTSIGTLGEDRPVLLIHHGGTQMGGVAFWAIYPELDISVAVVANSGNQEVRGAVQTTAYALVRALVDSQ
jgi:CubicO group peptidase (beta-lactamase class C family)